MSVMAMTKPACAGCGRETADRQRLMNAEGRALGMVCERCYEDGLGFQEAIYHAFGGRRANHSDDAREPYYVPSGLNTFDELKTFALKTVQRNPDLRAYLNPPPPTRALVAA